MTKLSLGHSRVGRVWIGGLPDAEYPVWETIDRDLSCEGGRPFKQGCAAIELLIPRGAHIEYGLIGCRFDAAPEMAAVAVHCSPPEYERAFPGSLAEGLDSVAVGLPCEFAEAALEGALAGLARRGGMVPGALQFGVAVHGRVGSSSRTFQLLASLGVAMLDCESSAHDDALAGQLGRLIE